MMCGDRYCTPEEKCGLNSACIKIGDYSSLNINFIQPIPPTSTLIIKWTAFPYPLDLNVDNVSFRINSRMNPDMPDAKATPANSQFNVQDGSWTTTFTGVNLASGIYTLTLLVDNVERGVKLFNVQRINPNINPNNNPGMF